MLRKVPPSGVTSPCPVRAHRTAPFSSHDPALVTVPAARRPRMETSLPPGAAGQVLSWRGCLVAGKKASQEDSPVNTDEDVETQSHQMLAGDDARDFSFLLPEFYVVPHPEVTQQVT